MFFRDAVFTKRVGNSIIFVAPFQVDAVDVWRKSPAGGNRPSGAITPLRGC
ncbi:MAG: hypothetical protein IKP00_15910 [Victivallales bacterium]|nr:hypothetical protein [Victivallales bacterium]